jgi:hypothetical protein
LEKSTNYETSLCSFNGILSTITKFKLREEHRLTIFENRVLRRIFGPQRDEVREVGENYIMRSIITCTLLQV